MTRSFAALAAIATLGLLGAVAAPAKPPLKTVTVSIGAAPNPVVYGSATRVAGRVTGGTLPTSVTLQQAPYPYTKYSNVASANTDALGNYAFTGLRPALNTKYRAKVKSATSAIKTVYVRVAITLYVSDSTPARGQRVRFSGVARPAHNGRSVRLQRRFGDGVYRTVAKTTLRARTSTSSKYTLYKRIYSNGTYRVRVGADLDHEANNSRTRKLTVG